MKKDMKKVQKTCMLFLVVLTVGFMGILPTQTRPRAKRVVILGLGWHLGSGIHQSPNSPLGRLAG